MDGSEKHFSERLGNAKTPLYNPPAGSDVGANLINPLKVSP